MRREPERPERGDEAARVIALIAAHGGPAPQVRGHREGRLAFRESRRLTHTGVDDEPMPVLHEDVSLIGELRLVPVTLAAQPGLGIRGGGVRGVRPPLPVKVHRRIARIVGRWDRAPFARSS